MIMDTIKTTRNDWTKEEIEEIYHLPLMELIYIKLLPCTESGTIRLKFRFPHYYQ